MNRPTIEIRAHDDRLPVPGLAGTSGERYQVETPEPGDSRAEPRKRRFGAASWRKRSVRIPAHRCRRLRNSGRAARRRKRRDCASRQRSGHGRCALRADRMARAIVGGTFQPAGHTRHGFPWRYLRPGRCGLCADPTGWCHSRSRRGGRNVRRACLLVVHSRRSGLSQLLSEFVATFGLIGAVWTCSRVRPSSVAGVVAAYIGGAFWFTATDFANRR